MTTASFAFDRPAIFRAAWAFARDAAARTGEAVKQFLSTGLRSAWANARTDRAAAVNPFAARRQAVVAAGMVCEPHPTWPGWRVGFGATLTPDGRPSCTTVNNEEQAVDMAEEALANYRSSQQVQQPQPEQTPEPAPAPEPIVLELGRVTITRDERGIRLVGQVTGGGANGPGTIYEATGFTTSDRLRWAEDRRSGSGRSGSVVWQLQLDRLYSLAHVAYNSSKSASYWLSTFDGDLTELSLDEYRAECARLWPLQAYEAEQAEVRRAEANTARIEAERREVERLRAEAEARKAANADEAARIEREGQPAVEGLPSLKGSPKQIAYALKIRSAVQASDPTDKALKSATTAKYWIENRRNALWA